MDDVPAVHDLGTVRLVAKDGNDERFVYECLEAVLCSTLHTIAFVRAFGVCAPRECQYLHYACEDSGTDVRLYVATVEDADLHFRIASVAKIAARTLQNDLAQSGKGAVQLEIELGTTDSAHRKRLQNVRAERRMRRAESLFQRRRSEDTGGVIQTGTPASPTFIGSLPKWVSGGGGGGGGGGDSGRPAVTNMLQESTEAMLAESPPVVALGATDHVWHAAVSKVENALVENHSFSSSRTSLLPASETLTTEERALLKKAVLAELKQRAVEDDRQCKRVWEHWRVEIRLRRGTPTTTPTTKYSGAKQEIEVFELDDFGPGDVDIETFEDRQERSRARNRYAKRVRDLCKQLMMVIIDRAAKNIDYAPPITESGVQQPLCWPMRFHVRRDTRKPTRSKSRGTRLHSSCAGGDSMLSSTSSVGFKPCVTPSTIDDNNDDDSQWPPVSPASCSPPSALDIGRDLLREFVRGGPGYGGTW